MTSLQEPSLYCLVLIRRFVPSFSLPSLVLYFNSESERLEAIMFAVDVLSVFYIDTYAYNILLT